LKLAGPFGLGSCPKVDQDADDADRVPEGAKRIWNRAHGATGHDSERPSSDFSDSYDAERQPKRLSRRAGYQGVVQHDVPTRSKRLRGITMRGANNGYPGNPRRCSSFR
jgi:hypothetical protein